MEMLLQDRGDLAALKFRRERKNSVRAQLISPRNAQLN